MLWRSLQDPQGVHPHTLWRQGKSCERILSLNLRETFPSSCFPYPCCAIFTDSYNLMTIRGIRNALYWLSVTLKCDNALTSWPIPEHSIRVSASSGYSQAGMKIKRWLEWVKCIEVRLSGSRSTGVGVEAGVHMKALSRCSNCSTPRTTCVYIPVRTERDAEDGFFMACKSDCTLPRLKIPHFGCTITATCC